MYRSIIASAALVAAVRAGGCGDAIVINKCSYDVHLSNTPASGGGYSAIDQTLSPGGQYSQTYTELSNQDGWSLKLSKTAGSFESDILQYEYTYHNDGIIWFDLSEVNGNPWDGNWEITANNGCTPRQAAYRYATDDAYGMQSCDSGSSVTVTLCSGDSGSGSGSSSPSGSAPASSPAYTAPTSAAPVPTTSTTKQHGHHGHHTWDAAGDAAAKLAAPKVQEHSTTLATSPSPAWDGPAVTVTNVHMETMTQYVTATAAAAKRHVHHPRHAHNHI